MAVLFPVNVHHGEPIPKVLGRGRKKYVGRNFILLEKMRVGDSLWDIPRKKCLSIRHTAYKLGISVSIRRLPNNLFGIWRMS